MRPSYIICWIVLPTQQNALVEAVSKSTIQLPAEFIQAMELDPFVFHSKGAVAYEEPPDPKVLSLMRFVPLDEIEKALQRHVNNLDVAALANQSAQVALDKARGRI